LHGGPALSPVNMPSRFCKEAGPKWSTNLQLCTTAWKRSHPSFLPWFLLAYTLPGRQGFSWGGCKRSRRPPSICSRSRSLTFAWPDDWTLVFVQSTTNYTNYTIRRGSRTHELPGDSVSPTSNGVFYPKYAAYTSPQAQPVLQETNGHV
jgi:hypothetical protein